MFKKAPPPMLSKPKGNIVENVHSYEDATTDDKLKWDTNSMNLYKKVQRDCTLPQNTLFSSIRISTKHRECLFRD